MTNTIKFELTIVSENKTLILDKINFKNCACINIFIDNKNIRHMVDFEDMLVVFLELQKSVQGSGKYLIFTCACGVADDGGWEFIEVRHSEENIEWSFNRGKRYFYKFNKHLYVEKIQNLIIEISKMKGYTLIPQNIIYPLY